MVERVLVVGPKDTISMVDDLAPKGFEIVKALHNSPEMKAALPGTTYFVGFVQQYVTPTWRPRARAAFPCATTAAPTRWPSPSMPCS